MIIKGLISRKIFFNYQNGYCVFRVKTDNGNITCSGILPELPCYTPVCIEGHFDFSNKYPDTLIVDKLIDWDDTSVNNIKFMAYGLGIKGLSFAIAESMNEYLNEPLFLSVGKTANRNEFSRLFPADYQEFARKIFDVTKNIIIIKELFDKIFAAGGTYNDALRLHEKFGDRALSVLEQNPYQTGLFLEWDFNIAETIAKSTNMSPWHKNRGKGILKYALTSIVKEGNTCASLSNIISRISFFLSQCILEKLPIEYIMSFAITDNDIMVEKRNNEYIFTYKYLNDAENTLLRHIGRLSESKTRLNLTKIDVACVEQHNNIQFSNEQKKVFDSLMSSGIKIVKGGPGCGKTTTINGLIYYLKEICNKEVCLGAPTGCAAQHMTENSGYKSSTFHYLLGLRPFDVDCVPEYNERNHLPYKYYIFDEFSMADIEVCSYLFAALPNNSCVIIVGDPDQLESVAPGNVLSDFIDSGLFEIYQLNTTFRQKEGSPIIANANKIKNKNTNFVTNEDFNVSFFDSESAVVDSCVNYLKNTELKLPQILTPIKKNTSGSKNLNKIIQSLKHSDSEKFKVYGDYTFYVNDKVIALKNNSKNGYFNGESGVITLIDDEGVLIRFNNGDEIYFKNSKMNEIAPAYALTIHKSQGNEFPEVVLILTNNSKTMINKKTLYTAITRAKKKVTIFCQTGCLNYIPDAKKRHTMLTEKLISLY